MRFILQHITMHVSNEAKGGTSKDRMVLTRVQRVLRIVLKYPGPYIRLNVIAQRVTGVKNEEIKGIILLL